MGQHPLTHDPCDPSNNGDPCDDVTHDSLTHRLPCPMKRNFLSRLIWQVCEFSQKWSGYSKRNTGLDSPTGYGVA